MNPKKPLDIKQAALHFLILGVFSFTSSAAYAYPFQTSEDPQIIPTTQGANDGWKVKPLVTIGETNGAGADINLNNLAYRPVGILDGMDAYALNDTTVRVLANHENGSTTGYSYTLANGLSLKGSRVSFFDIDKNSRQIVASGLAYDKIFDRTGAAVTSAPQVNEGASTTEGFDRFCSAQGWAKNEMGFVNNVYLTGEESSSGLGGQLAVVDVDGRSLYVAPMLGRAAFENVTALDPKKSNKVALLISDDTAPAPLLLYIGEKGAVPAGPYTPPQFLIQNGLGSGSLFTWVADNGNLNPSQWKGTGSSRSGKFVKIQHYNPALAGTSGYDSLGFASAAQQKALAAAVGAFQFSRPEDVSTHPRNGQEAVLVSTGRSSLFGGADTWGMTYIINVKLDSVLNMNASNILNVPAGMSLVYDGNDAGGGQFPHPDNGLRSPDNLDWAKDGLIYIQEDRAESVFAQTSGEEASVWQLNPKTGAVARILQIDRTAVPTGQLDPVPTDIGNWESSGILDVSELFSAKDGANNFKEQVFILNVQAHSLSGTSIGGSSNLAEGGQLLLMTRKK